MKTPETLCFYYISNEKSRRRASLTYQYLVIRFTRCTMSCLYPSIFAFCFESPAMAMSTRRLVAMSMTSLLTGLVLHVLQSEVIRRHRQSIQFIRTISDGRESMPFKYAPRDNPRNSFTAIGYHAYWTHIFVHILYSYRRSPSFWN